MKKFFDCIWKDFKVNEAINVFDKKFLNLYEITANCMKNNWSVYENTAVYWRKLLSVYEMTQIL